MQLLNVYNPIICQMEVVLPKITFQGSINKSFSSSQTLDYIEKNIINATNDTSRKSSIANFRQHFSKIYDLGADKWQNPKYHQFTITDHMLKAIEQAALIVNGKHNEIDTCLNSKEKATLLKMFNDKIDGIPKSTLFVLAMAFHDLDKVTKCKPRLTENGDIWTIMPLEHKNFIEEIDFNKEQSYWTAHYDPDDAIALFKQISKEINLPENAEKYVCNILIHHDNPLRYIIWEIENGQHSISKLFDEMKQQTPFSMKELAVIYLADQSAKGEQGWLNHLESVSPWRCLFKSMLYERPLAELNQLISN